MGIGAAKLFKDIEGRVIPRPPAGKHPTGKLILYTPRYFETFHEALRMFRMTYNTMGQDDVSS
jgi:hypothetical protein